MQSLKCFLTGLVLTLSVAVSAQSDSESRPDTHVVEVEDGVFLHVIDWGGAGPPLLFIPSWGATSHIFDDFVPRFTDSYHVLVMNKRGHGPSTRPDHGYTIPRLIKDIEGVLDALNIDQVNLVGLSRAESLTTQFAANYPGRVQSLVYLSGPYDRAYDREFSSQPGIEIMGYRRSALDDAIRALCFIRENFVRPPGSFDEIANNLGIEWRDTDPSPPYQDVEAPALALWAPLRGQGERFRESCARFSERDVAEVLIARYLEVSEPFFARMDHDIKIFSEELHNSELIEIPGAVYHTFVSHPEVVEKEMRRFLDRVN